MTPTQKSVIKFLSELAKVQGGTAVEQFASLLGYKIILNPTEANSCWFLLEHPTFNSNDEALMAVKYDEELDEETPIGQLRKRYEEVDKQKIAFGSFSGHVYSFVGKGRIVLFRAFGGHRDERLDISTDSISRVSFYADSLLSLHKNALKLQEDAFGQTSVSNGSNCRLNPPYSVRSCQ